MKFSTHYEISSLGHGFFELKADITIIPPRVAEEVEVSFEVVEDDENFNQA